jgi:hypothetical protein
MGPWDIMSQHLVERGQPCPGLSSFTKIRLGWISQEKALLVKTGETSLVFLSPLAQQGDKLVIKIPLHHDNYYLIENRQPIGYDKVLPDSGILILKVNTGVQEGYGTVQVINAEPAAPNFSKATYKPGTDGRNIYLDKKNNVAVIPLWKEEGNLGVLITTAEKSPLALKAATTILEHMKSEKNPERTKKIRDAVAAFKVYEFERSYAIAGSPLGSD